MQIEVGFESPDDAEWGWQAIFEEADTKFAKLEIEREEAEMMRQIRTCKHEPSRLRTRGSHDAGFTDVGDDHARGSHVEGLTQVEHEDGKVKNEDEPGDGNVKCEDETADDEDACKEEIEDEEATAPAKSTLEVVVGVALHAVYRLINSVYVSQPLSIDT